MGHIYCSRLKVYNDTSLTTQEPKVSVLQAFGQRCGGIAQVVAKEASGFLLKFSLTSRKEPGL